MTIPPLFRAAMAIASISPWTASPSIDRLPSSSAVVPRMTATSIGKAWNSSHSRPRSVTTSTRSSVVRAFCLPPVWRGSTYVPRPTWVRSPGRPAAISRISCERTPCGNEYDSISLASTSAPSRGSLPMLLPIVRRWRPERPELREAAIGEVADADDPDRRQVARRAGLGVDRGELVDEPLRQGVAGAGSADDDGAAVADEPDGVADVEDGRHGM